MTDRTVVADGYQWTVRNGGLWCTYAIAAEYQGLANEAAARNYAHRHELRRIRLGRHVLVSKADLDRVSGALVN